MPYPFVPVPETAKFELVFTFQGEVVENVYHVTHPGGWTEGTLNAKCSDIYDWWVSNLRAQHPTSATFERILATDQSSQFGPRVEWVDSLPSAGTKNNTGILPNHVTVAVKWLTGSRGRSYRGRTYHFGLTGSDTSGNNLQSATRTALLTAYENLLTAVAGSGSDHLVVASRMLGGAPRAVGVATNITAAEINAVLDSQRRRLPGRGT